MRSRGHQSGGEAGSARVRLQRVLAAAGIAARRAAEEMIEQGRVVVNGEVVSRLPAFVDPHTDRIEVDGRVVPKAQRQVYIMVNKPERTLTAADEEGVDRATVLDLVDHPAKPRLFPVGRLDWTTAGLVLLTNDGEMANKLTHPRFGVTKTYRAVVRGNIAEAQAREIEGKVARLVKKDDRQAGRVRSAGTGRIGIEIEGVDDGRTVLVITIREGRTGNLARMLAGAGVSVKKLERIAIGPLELRGLARGRWRELERGEIHALRAAARGERKERAAPKAKDPRSPVGRRVARRPGGKRAGAPRRGDRRRR
jgi:23S rRNA pseudouridine2605 synthase